MTNQKANAGRYFEDFRLGHRIVHATPRTVTEGDVALYTALYGSRFAIHSSAPFAASLGFPQKPIDDLFAFNLVFGKTVPDVSVNAIANLGYAGGRFGVPLYCGDTVTATSIVIGLKPNRDGLSGIVYVHSVGENQRGEMVLEYSRWVMVKKRDPAAAPPEPVVPDLPPAVDPSSWLVPPELQGRRYDAVMAGSPHLWEDYEVGEKIDHMEGMTIEESEHMMATRLYQNTARVHFNRHAERGGRFGRRIVYGGHVISLVRALSFNGLGNAIRIAAINAGRHVAPTFAGDTIYAWSEVRDKVPLPGRSDLGGLRLRTVATKDRPCSDYPGQDAEGRYDPAVVLDLHYDVLMPTRGQAP